MPAEHSYVVPAYGHSPYLERCLVSLREQVQKSSIIVSTSTPFEGLQEVTDRHGAKLVVHSPNKGIGHDWNHALDQAITTWVTLAHQDDIYDPHYTQDVMGAAARHPDALIVFTDAKHIIDGTRRRAKILPAVKKGLLELGFLGRESARSRWARLNSLRFGNSIPCPAVTINRMRSNVLFDETMRTNMDWAAWLELCERDGSFVYVRKPLVIHRIHPGSETSETISSGQRTSEDEIMLERLWPRWIARGIARTYALAYSSNSI